MAESAPKALGPATTATDEAQYDPSGRYQKTDTRIEQARGIRHVYKAFDTETAVEVAWQEYWGVSAATMNAIEKTIDTLKSLSHQHIIKYHEGWVDRKQKKVIFITEAMPTGRGSITNVRRFLSRNVKMKSSVLRKWLGQILLGLEFLHSCELPWIHRDLRCENIYIRSNVGRLKVGGLELGIFMQASHPAEFDGTPGYMPPDLANDTFDEKSDVYSFGMCALEMFTFKYPYGECATSYQIFKKQLNGDAPEALSLVDDKVAVDLIASCLAPVAQRPTVAELFQHPFFTREIPPPTTIESEDDPLVLASKPSDTTLSRPVTPIDTDPSLTTSYGGSELAPMVLALRNTTVQPQPVILPDPSIPVNSTIKCFSSDNQCIRIYFRDISCIHQLKSICSEDFEYPLDSIQLHYIDDEDDKILITKRTTIKELIEFAKFIRVSTS